MDPVHKIGVEAKALHTMDYKQPLHAIINFSKYLHE